MEKKLNHPIVAHVYCDDKSGGVFGFLYFWFRTLGFQSPLGR